MPIASDPQGCLSFPQFVHRRNRTVDAINQLNSTLLPPLDIRTLSVARVDDYISVENNTPVCSYVSRECQTNITGEVRPTGANWSEDGATRAPVSCKTGPKRFLCRLCGLQYKWRSSVYRHVKGDHQVNREMCAYCHVPFSNETLLYAHLQLRQELGWCRASRGIESTESEVVVPAAMGREMPGPYSGIDLWT